MKMLVQEAGKGARVLPGGPVTNLIYRSLVRMVGPSNADAIEFYVDTRLAVDDPAGYERSVKLLLGEYGGHLVIDGLKTELAKGSGTERSSESFFSQVRAAERAFRANAASARPTEVSV
jgi:hypothetical protein